MALEDRFAENVRGWREHCNGFGFGVDPRRYTDCDAYRAIVQLGAAALPLIREAYLDEKLIGTHRWDSAVKAIMGTAFEIPKEFLDDPEKAKAYTIGWIDRHLSVRTKTARFTT
ncbi:hypothetical protein HY493_00225 [Candidatus Woesearchaeota archaeon]|nr:hypothetical protein [Candidatus Woesearchaeota archaeon]